MTHQARAKALRSPVATVAPVGSTDGYMGDLVAWQFARGGDHAFKAPRTKVRQVFEEACFGEYVDSKRENAADALAEASRQARIGRGIIAEAFEKKNDDTPYSIGVYYKAGQGEKGDDMVCCARARVMVRAGVEIVEVLEPEGGVPPWANADQVARCRAAAAEIAKGANLRLTHVLSTELSDAIVSAGRSCYWASFRRAGGVYWVHASYAPRIRQLLDGLETLGGFWATLQPLHTDGEGRTLRNVRSAATGALEAELDDLIADLTKAQTKGMLDKAVESRRVRCQELIMQADLYRAVLETSHAGIVQRIERVLSDFSKLLDTSETDKAFDNVEGI